MPYRDYRDLVVDDLAADLARTEAVFVEALRDREAFQLLAKAAIERIADLTTQNGRLQSRIARLVGEVRDKRTAEPVTREVLGEVRNDSRRPLSTDGDPAWH